MIWRTTALALCLALPLGAEPVEIMYYNFLGEYLIESPYQVDIEVPGSTLDDIQATLEKFRNSTYAMDSDLVVIGYGPEGSPSEFFAATPFVNYQIPLQNVLDHVPERIPNGKWYVYFINRSLSHYVRARQDHHWASPFRWLAQVGLQNLHYFGPL